MSAPVKGSAPPPEAQGAARPTAETPTAERLLDAATAAFADRGFHGTTTRDIAALAGVSPATLYVHYATKEAVLYAISLAGHQGVLAAVREASAGAVSPTARLAAVAERLAWWHARWHVRARVVHHELGALTPAHRDTILVLRRDIEHVVRSVVEAGLATGEFATDHPAMASRSITSLGADIARWYRRDRDWSPEEVAAHVRDTSLRIVGAGPR